MRSVIISSKRTPNCEKHTKAQLFGFRHAQPTPRQFDRGEICWFCSNESTARQIEPYVGLKSVSCTKNLLVDLYLQRGAETRLGRKAAEDQERGNRDHVQLLGRVWPQAAGAHEEGKQHPAVPAEMSWTSSERVQRAEDCQRGSVDVRQRGSDHSSTLHILWLHRHEGAREERPIVQLWRAWWCQDHQRRNCGKGWISRWQSLSPELVREEQAHLPCEPVGALQSRKKLGQVYRVGQRSCEDHCEVTWFEYDRTLKKNSLIRLWVQRSVYRIYVKHVRCWKREFLFCSVASRFYWVGALQSAERVCGHSKGLPCKHFTFQHLSLRPPHPSPEQTGKFPFQAWCLLVCLSVWATIGFGGGGGKSICETGLVYPLPNCHTVGFTPHTDLWRISWRGGGRKTHPLEKMSVSCFPIMFSFTDILLIIFSFFKPVARLGLQVRAQVQPLYVCLCVPTTCGGEGVWTDLWHTGQFTPFQTGPPHGSVWGRVPLNQSVSHGSPPPNEKPCGGSFVGVWVEPIVGMSVLGVMLTANSCGLVDQLSVFSGSRATAKTSKWQKIMANKQSETF